jgi:hypothetical protein
LNLSICSVPHEDYSRDTSRETKFDIIYIFIKLFGFAIFWLFGFLRKVIPEIRYLRVC